VASTDSCAWDVNLSVGSWWFAMIGIKTSASAIMTFLLDGVVLFTVDMYAAAQVNNFNYGNTFNVTANGKHRLSVTNATKNASATNYGVYIQSLVLQRLS